MLEHHTRAILVVTKVIDFIIITIDICMSATLCILTV